MTEVFSGSPAMTCEDCVNSQALQVALELSMLNINSGLATADNPYMMSDLDVTSKSLNVTQCVSVPSSEHVAEIVGKQGCKIKALRAKTNTYIKTPVKGEDPVFSISGRPDHVNSAKWEILAAAEHFTQIRASRPQASSMTGSDKVTIFVRVPYRVVGLVVGPRGSTVKRIQQLTRTFIVTPSRDKEPCFEVRGTPENVERAKKEIESYIVFRTGNKQSIDEEACDGLYGSSNSTNLLAQQLQQQCQLGGSPMYQYSDALRSSPTSGNSLGLSGSGLDLAGFGKGNGTPELDGGGSPQDWTIPSTTVFSGMRFTPPDTSYHPLAAPLLAPAVEKAFDVAAGGTMNCKQQPLSPTGSYESTSSDGGLGVGSPKQSPLTQKRATTFCCMCYKSDEDAAALVPCGHNGFCQTCAHYIACSTGSCPICCAQVINVMHI